jgi:hypothetical protein
LNVSKAGNQVVLSWGDASYVLQQNTADVANPASWADVNPPAVSPWTNAVPSGNTYYRLRKP